MTKKKFVCQDSLNYIPVIVKKDSARHLMKYSYRSNKHNKKIYILLAIIAFILSFTVMKFNIGDKISSKVLPDAYRERHDSSNDGLEMLTKYKFLFENMK